MTFLRRAVPWWFMKPLKSNAGSAMAKGSRNEGQIINVLPRYVPDFSSGMYKIQKIETFGLLVKRDVTACASSPDGVFALLKKLDDDTYKFVSLCVLEIKTRSALGTVDALCRQSLGGNRWTECNAGSSLFKEAIRDPPYRSQICQHAAALGINRILMVYSLPGALPRKMVLVNVSDAQRGTLVTLQQLLSTKYMPFCYVDGSEAEIPSLGEDYSSVYGYAQTHDCLELWFLIWKAYDVDVRTNVTPPSCRRFIDLATCFWNKCMGNVDTLRKIVKGARAIRGPDSGPGSLFWFTLLDYIFYQAFQHYQHGQMESKLDDFKSFKQFQQARKKNKSYRAYLRLLSNYIGGLDSNKMDEYFPGLRQQVNRRCTSQTEASTRQNTTDMAAVSIPESSAPTAKKSIDKFMDPDTDLFQKRLNKGLNHRQCRSAKKTIEKRGTDKSEVERCVRGDCIVCCRKCDKYCKETPIREKHTRRGRATVNFCSVCKVYLCKNCFDTFHLDEIPDLPPCIEVKYGLSGRRHLRLDSDPLPRSPLRTTLRRQRASSKDQPSPSSPSSTVSSSPRINRAAHIIGKKLRLRATGGGQSLALKSPALTSPLRSIQR